MEGHIREHGLSCTPVFHLSCLIGKRVVARCDVLCCVGVCVCVHEETHGCCTHTHTHRVMLLWSTRRCSCCCRHVFVAVVVVVPTIMSSLQVVFMPSCRRVVVLRGLCHCVVMEKDRKKKEKE